MVNQRHEVCGNGDVHAGISVHESVGPNPGEDYRVALGAPGDDVFQFARATVNYIWKEFFALGLVDPTNQFDVARQDPDNPPPDPWTLQASNPRLLNALAQGLYQQRLRSEGVDA